MPEYDFEDIETGELVGVFYSMSDPSLPSIGEVIDHKGRRIRRIVSRHLASVRGFKPHIAAQIPLNDPLSPRLNEEGETVFHSQKEVEEYVARNNDTPGRGKIAWDP
ncbi:MAG: hypothetical protein D6746_08510 [Bacteroidetes bacterium]|nr:MAG: hypothetical protein D6746_08510 [Bacteroidota bacterium]